MTFIHENISIIRGVLLVLLVVAIIGPWTFDRINVPAEYPCDAPFVRLEGDFCGTPMLGINLVFWFIIGIPQVIWELLSGELPLVNLAASVFPLSLILLVVLPLVTTFFLLLKRDVRFMQLLHAIALVIATGMGLWIVIHPEASFQWRLWGMWLYFSLVALMLILEVMGFIRRRKQQDVTILMTGS